MAPELNEILRLLIAAVVGGVIGFDREMRNKPLGLRTLALVSLGAAMAPLAALHYLGSAPPDATARILQGTVTGVLTGIGFLGAGVVLHGRRGETVHGLTTAATVWVAAALGIACALADWTVVASGVVFTLAILLVLGWIEKRFLPK